MTEEVTATHKGASISAQKVRLVLKSISRKKLASTSIASILDELRYSKKKAALLVKKVLDSAIANAEHNAGLDIDDLYISAMYANEGTTLKRMRARAKGRSDRILKRSCHITIKVAQKRS